MIRIAIVVVVLCLIISVVVGQSESPASFCARQNLDAAIDNYFCSPDETGFYMCLQDPYTAQSAFLMCPAGTDCESDPNVAITDNIICDFPTSPVASQCTLQSIQFGSYVNLNAGGCPGTDDSGCGYAFADQPQIIYLQTYNDGSSSFISTADGVNAYLRLDARDGACAQPTDNGCGTVDVLTYPSGPNYGRFPEPPANSYELFDIHYLSGNPGDATRAISIQSVAFPNIYLRVADGGVVNAQYYAPGTEPDYPHPGLYEIFYLNCA